MKRGRLRQRYQSFIPERERDCEKAPAGLIIFELRLRKIIMRRKEGRFSFFALFIFIHYLYNILVRNTSVFMKSSLSFVSLSMLGVLRRRRGRSRGGFFPRIAFPMSFYSSRLVDERN